MCPAKIRPGVEPSPEATEKALQGPRKFVDIRPNTTAMVRFLPPPTQQLFVQSLNHYRLKDQDGRGIALACLRAHGTDETSRDCWICELVEYLTDLNVSAYNQIAKDLKAGPKNYGMVTMGEKQPDETWQYQKVQLLGINGKGGTAINEVLKRQKLVGQVLFTDIEKGQSVLVTRTGSGFNQTYTAEKSGVVESLDVIRPTWEDEYIPDILAALELKIYTRDMQRAYVKLAFGDRLDWDAIDAAVSTGGK